MGAGCIQEPPYHLEALLVPEPNLTRHDITAKLGS